MNDTSSLSLFVLFIQGFSVSDIYLLGWEAAASWMAVVSGVLIAIAIGIRSAEEQINLLTTGDSNWMRMFTNVIVIAIAIGLYFVLASLVIDFFNAIYSILNSSPTVEMAKDLDGTLDKLMNKEHKFQLSEIGDAFFAAFAFVLYWLTHMALVLVTLAMRIAHAILVSWCLFWGAIALPMSITTGLKMLTGFKNLCIMVLIWPIVESFFMYLIGGSFSNMLNSGYLNVDGFDTWNMGLLVFYLTAYSIINILLVATLVSAPFVAQGMANNTGNVSGMIGSFGAAGIAAGVLAAKAMMPGQGTKAVAGNAIGAMRKKDNSMNIGQAAGAGVGAALQAGKNMFSPPSSAPDSQPNSQKSSRSGGSSSSESSSPSVSDNTSNATNQGSDSTTSKTNSSEEAPQKKSNTSTLAHAAMAQSLTGSDSLSGDGSASDIEMEKPKSKPKKRSKAAYFANKANRANHAKKKLT